jgi:hypothetical protein
MKDNILDLFNLVQKKSIQLHKTGKGNGLIFWRSIKNTLKKYDLQTTKWSNKVLRLKSKEKTFYNKVWNLDENIDHNHFLIQHLRLPEKDSATPRKILQIALNSGQLKKYLAADNFEVDLIQTYKKLKLDKIETYISLSKANFKFDKGLYKEINKQLSKFL